MVTGGQPSPSFTDDDLHERRILSAAWLEWACRGGTIDKSDPRYTLVTEGRDRTPQDQKVYSSCADLYHWLLFRLGVREPWLNRKEHRGWRPGVAINRLYPPPIGTNPYARRWTHDEPKLEAGDCLVIGTVTDTRWHVVPVIDELGAAPIGRALNTLCTAEYGARGMQVGGIGGHLVTRAWSRYTLGDRVVRVVLRLEDVLRGAFRKGLLVDPERPPQAEPDEVPTQVSVPRPQR